MVSHVTWCIFQFLFWNIVEMNNNTLFTRLPPPAVIVIDDYDEAILPVVEVIDLTMSSTPPLILRDEQFDVLFISESEFLESIDGFTPSPMHLRSCPCCLRGYH